MHRRHFLEGLGVSAGLLVIGTACSSDGPPAVDAEPTLAVQAASIEYLAGPDRWVAFGLEQLDRTPVENADVEVYIRTISTSPETQPEVVAGPLAATFSPAQETGRGVYYLQATFAEPGFFDILAVVGDDHGSSAVRVVDPVDSAAPVPGSAAISAATATTAADLGVFSICTQDPPCGMHERSLDEALATGQPVALMFATPEFCQSAVCGPSVATLDALRTGADWGDTIFIHSEIYAQAPVGDEAPVTPLVPAVEAWQLPSEPWMYTIAADGVILDRLDGPMPGPILEAMLNDLSA